MAAPVKKKVANPKPADLNEDGKVTAKERRTYKKSQEGNQKGDVLSKEELAKRYGYALRVLESDPELWQLFQRASNFKKGQWSDDEFQAQLMDTNWWKNNSESARKGLTAKAMGGEDWNAMMREARTAVTAEATKQGWTLDNGKIDQLAEQYIMGGWDQADRAQQLTNAIVQAGQQNPNGGFLEGKGGNLQQQLLEMARANGLQISEDYAAQAARSVALGLSTEDDWLRQTRQMAASVWGQSWEKQIMAGVDARQLASGYINLMATEWDMNPEQIDLNDPFLRAAMTGVNPDGSPRQESLFEFQQRLRQDPRWMKTKAAEDSISSIGMDVLQKMGFVG